VYQSGSKIGVNTTNPAQSLDVFGGILHVTGIGSPTTAVQGAYLGWNALTGGVGETDFINNQGQGSGAFAFMNTPGSGSPRSTLMFINGTGNVGIGKTNPAYQLDVAATAQVGRLIVNGGVTATGSGFKHARTTASCTTGSNPGDRCYFTISWPGLAFADTNYTTTCTAEYEVGGPSIIVSTKTTSNITVTVVNDGVLDGDDTVTGLDCIAIHD
jgi:hypothetical protein